MTRRYDIMSYRQDLHGFGEPNEGSWDGFQRINTDTKTGGIIGVFTHGAIEKERIVTVNYLDPAKMYKVKTMTGKVIATLTRAQLKTKGFEVDLKELYSGKLYEVSLSK